MEGWKEVSEGRLGELWGAQKARILWISCRYTCRGGGTFIVNLWTETLRKRNSIFSHKTIFTWNLFFNLHEMFCVFCQTDEKNSSTKRQRCSVLQRSSCLSMERHQGQNYGCSTASGGPCRRRLYLFQKQLLMWLRGQNWYLRGRCW